MRTLSSMAASGCRMAGNGGATAVEVKGRLGPPNG
jgi:hypothetical protein